jgi:acyl-CoA dehydrogenase
MTFSLALTEEQKAAQAWARAFAVNEMREAEVDGVKAHRYYDEEETFPWPIVQKAAEVGLYGMDYYTMAGQDPTGITSALIIEELFWGCAGIGLAIFGSGLALAGLASAGTGEQIGRWAPRIFGTPDDVKIGAYAVSEPGAGSDVSKIRTTATKVEGGWLLNGEKIWITNGGIADVHIVVATVDKNLGHRGQASFIVTSDAEGFEMTKKTLKLGIRASHTAELAFTDVFIPDDQLLGGQDKLDAKMERAKNPSKKKPGSSGALSTFEATRPIVGIQAVGIARAAFDASVTYATQRETFGVPIWRPRSTPRACCAGAASTWARPRRRSSTARDRWRSSLPVAPQCVSPTKRSRSTVGSGTAASSTSRSSTATARSTRSSRAPRRFSSWSSPVRSPAPSVLGVPETS